MINSQDQEDFVSGNSLRQNQRRMNKLFYDEDHKNMKTFHLKNQMDNDILVKDEQDDIYDFMQIASDQNRNSRIIINSNHSTFNQQKNIIQTSNNGIDEYTANWKNPSEVKRDPQKSITILNLQSMDETSKQMIQNENQFQKKLRLLQSPIAVDQTMNLLNALNGNSQNMSHSNSDQSIKPLQKATFPYNVYQTANRLRQKLMNKLERVRIQSITPTHLHLIDDWASSVNNHQCACQNEECKKEDHLDNVNKKVCCFQRQLQNCSKLNDQGINNQQQLQCIHEATKQLESISIGSNSNFTSKKKMLNLLQSVKSFKDQPTNSDSKLEKPKSRRSIFQIYSSILLMLACITKAINPTNVIRIAVDCLTVIFLYIFYFFITLRSIFVSEIDKLINNQSFNNKNSLLYYVASVGFVIQLLDLFLSYLTGFYRKGKLITDPNLASIRYFRKTFVFDFVSLMILLFHIINSEHPSGVIQLLYFIKVFSSTETLKRIKLKCSITKFRKLVYKIVVNGLFFCWILHSFTIAWIYIIQNEPQSPDLKANPTWLDSNSLRNQNWHYLYTASLQQMCSNLMFQGNQVFTQVEQLFVVLTQVSSVIFLLYFFQQFFKIIKLLRPFPAKSDIWNEYHKLIIFLLNQESVFINTFLPMRKLPEDMIIKAKQYLKYKRLKKQRKYSEQQIHSQLKILNFPLRDEILQNINRKIIDKMSIMKIFSDKLKIQLSKYLEEIQFETGQIVYYQGEETDNNLYFIGKGNVELFYITEKRCKDDENYLVFKKLTTGEHFGELSFFTSMPRESYARCSKEAIIFKISRDQFKEIMEDNQKDQEIFCEIKDDLILENNHSLISQVCPVCKKDKHQVLECSELHYVVDKEKLILRSNHPKIQGRSIHPTKRKAHKFNAWADQRSIQQSAQRVEENSTLYNKCVFDAINTSNGFYDQRLNQSNFDLDDMNEKLNEESHFELNNEPQQLAKQFLSYDGLPSKHNLVSTEFDFDKEQTNRRKSEFLQNLNTLNTTNKQRSFTKEEEFYLDQRSGTSFLYPMRKDTSHAIGGTPNNNPSSQGNILIPTQQEIAASPIPGEQSFFSNQFKAKSQQISKHNSNNLQNDEISNNTSIILFNGLPSYPQNQNSEFPQRSLSPEDFIDPKSGQQYAKDLGNSSSPIHRNKKKNLTWNIDQVQEIQTLANTPNQVIKGYLPNVINQSNNSQTQGHSTINQMNNNSNIVANSNIISNTNTTPLSYSSSNIANTNNNINQQPTTNNDIYDQNFQTSPNTTHRTRRISQTPMTLYFVHKEDQFNENIQNLKNKSRSNSSNLYSHNQQMVDSNNNQNNAGKNTIDSNYTEQVQFYQSPLIELQNAYNSNRIINSNAFSSNNLGTGYGFNSTANINNIILNSNNNIHGGGGSNLASFNNDNFTENSKMQKQTSTRKRTSSKYNDSQYKTETDSQNSTSQFKKVTNNNKKKKNLTIIQEQSPQLRNVNLMKKSSMINQIQNSHSMIPFQFDDSNASQLLPMATSMQFTNNYLDTKKHSIIKGRSQFNNSQLLSSLDFLQSQQQYQAQLNQLNNQVGLFGDLLPDQVEQSMLYSYYMEKSKQSMNKSKINLPKLSCLLPQFQQVQNNIQTSDQAQQFRQFQEQNYSKFFQNMNGRLRKSIALKKIQNNQEFLQDQRNDQQLYNFYPNFALQRNLRNNGMLLEDINKNYNTQYLSYIPKADEQLETIKEYQFYKPHNNIKVILKQIENSNKYIKKKRILNTGNSFYRYTLKIKQGGIK